MKGERGKIKLPNLVDVVTIVPRATEWQDWICFWTLFMKDLSFHRLILIIVLSSPLSLREKGARPRTASCVTALNTDGPWGPLRGCGCHAP